MGEHGEHPIAVPGLQCIQSWLKHKTHLSPLHPSKKRPWHLVFVVPSGMADQFQLQRFDEGGKGKGRGMGDWPSKVQQCVLGLEEEMIFGKEEQPSKRYSVEFLFLSAADKFGVSSRFTWFSEMILD
jgi:hypothetical protein